MRAKVLLAMFLTVAAAFGLSAATKREVVFKTSPRFAHWNYQPVEVQVTLIVKNPGEVFCLPWVISWGDGTHTMRQADCHDIPGIWVETASHPYKQPGDYPIRFAFIRRGKPHEVRTSDVRVLSGGRMARKLP